jgi:RNA polymerase sigma factor (sigma-70 family)
MADPDPADDSKLAREILEFSRTRLGNTARQHVERPEVLAAALARRKEGRNVEDAVLAEIHAALPGNRALADDFAAYLLFDLMKMGSNSMAASSSLRRFLDTGDLVLSVFGDLWHDVPSVRFESAGQFKTLFAQRLNWKAASNARRYTTDKRGEQHRLPHSPDELDLSATDEAPLTAAIREEERTRLILILLRLPDNHRRILTLHLRGLDTTEIAQRLGMQPDSARKALTRATEQARKLARQTDGGAALPAV